MEAAGFAESGLPGFVARACSRAGGLREAIAGRRFALAFQPIVSIGDRAVEHYEALLRPDPEATAEFGPPGDFVALAEMLGMSEELDWAVVEAASGAARRGAAAGRASRPTCRACPCGAPASARACSACWTASRRSPPA